MKYNISKINRSVSLDDELMAIYSEIDELDESLFLIPIYATLHHKEKEIEQSGIAPNDYLSDEELSLICNKAILNELKVYSFLPDIMKNIDSIRQKFFCG